MSKNKFLKNNLIVVSSSVIGGLLGFLFHFMVSRRLSVGEYGELQSIVSLSMLFGVFFSAFSYFTIKNSAVFALHNDREGQARFLVFMKKKFRRTILAFSVFFILLLPIIKNFLHLHDYWGVAIAGLSIIISFYAALYSNSLQGWSDFLGISTIGIAVVVAKLISGWVLASFFPNASAVAGSLLFAAAAGWLMARAYFWKKWKDERSLVPDGRWREKYFSGVNFRKSFIKILIFSFGMAAIGSADIIFIKSAASAQLAGYYAALSVLGKVIFSLNLAVVSVLFPDACADGYLGKPIRLKSILGSYALIFLISFPSVATFYFLPDFFVGTMFGPSYLDVASNLWLFGLMACALSLLTLESKMALARHDFKSSFLLILTVIFLGIGIAIAHSGIRETIISVSLAFLLGWLMMLALNFFHRLRHAAAGK
jgi:O-antigen/teichoic acid export membrane protein